MKLNFDPDWGVLKKALYYDKIGNWQKAHDLVDGLMGTDAALIHAYLHRKEGDLWNANYWYRKAGHEMPSDDVDEEWHRLWQAHV